MPFNIVADMDDKVMRVKDESRVIYDGLMKKTLGNVILREEWADYT